MSKHQQPTDSFFSKRLRISTRQEDAANDNQVAAVDLKMHTPNDISNSPAVGPTQVELLLYPVDANERNFARNG